MSTTGFLGTRADVFIDLAFVFFVAAPFVMTYALRLVALGRRRAHRNLQAGLLLAAVIATLLLEGSIRFGDGAAAFALSAYYGTPTMHWTFGVHLAFAVPTFVSWCVLTVLSWRRFSSVLPGPFSARHRRWGQLTYAGLWFTCITGVGLYVMSYAL